MKGKELFIFYLIFWVCGRLYIVADSYYLVKVFHSIGLHFDIFCLLCYIINISKEKYQKVFWRMFLVYESMGIIVFCKTQLLMDQNLAAELWKNGIRSSAANKIYGNIGFIQDFFIPTFIVLVSFLIYKISIEQTNGG